MTNLDFSHCEFNIHESEFKLIYNLPYNIPKSTFINGNFDFYLKKKNTKTNIDIINFQFAPWCTKIDTYE